MLAPATPVLCTTATTTATATNRVVSDITELFGGQWKTLRGSLLRESLHLYSFETGKKHDRMAWLAETCQSLEAAK